MEELDNMTSLLINYNSNTADNLMGWLDSAFSGLVTTSFTKPKGFSRNGDLETINQKIESCRSRINALRGNVTSQNQAMLNAESTADFLVSKLLGSIKLKNNSKKGNVKNSKGDGNKFFIDDVRSKSSLLGSIKLNNNSKKDNSKNSKKDGNKLFINYVRTTSSVKNMGVQFLFGLLDAAENKIDGDIYNMSTSISRNPDFDYYYNGNKTEIKKAENLMLKSNLKIVDIDFVGGMERNLYNIGYFKDMNENAYTPFKRNGVGSKVSRGVGYYVAPALITSAVLGPMFSASSEVSEGATALKVIEDPEWLPNVVKGTLTSLYAGNIDAGQQAEIEIDEAKNRTNNGKEWDSDENLAGNMDVLTNHVNNRGKVGMVAREAFELSGMIPGSGPSSIFIRGLAKGTTLSEAPIVYEIMNGQSYENAVEKTGGEDAQATRFSMGFVGSAGFDTISYLSGKIHGTDLREFREIEAGMGFAGEQSSVVINSEGFFEMIADTISDNVIEGTATEVTHAIME